MPKLPVAANIIPYILKITKLDFNVGEGITERNLRLYTTLIFPKLQKNPQPNKVCKLKPSWKGEKGIFQNQSLQMDTDHKINEIETQSKLVGFVSYERSVNPKANFLFESLKFNLDNLVRREGTE